MGPDRMEIIVSSSLAEAFSVDSGFRGLVKLLQRKATVTSSRNIFSKSALSRCKLLLLLGPRRSFSTDEVVILEDFLANGGNIFLSLTEDMADSTDNVTNLQKLLYDHGISIDNRPIIRPHYTKFSHPKEALIPDAIISRSSAQSKVSGPVVYPYGLSLTVSKPAVPLLTSGTTCFPLNRPLCALHASPGSGRVAVLGSTMMLHDSYLDQEQNSAVIEYLVDLLFTEKLPRHLSDDFELPDNEPFVDLVGQSNQVAPICDLAWISGGSPGKLFDSSYPADGVEAIAQLLKLYDDLGVASEPLTLVAPEFEHTLPPLEPAVYPPVMEDIGRPQLEMFDFNVELAPKSEKLQRAFQESSRTSDVHNYVREALHITGATEPSTGTGASDRDVLFEVARRIVQSAI